MNTKPRVLLVEDDLPMVQSMLAGLQGQGFDLTLCMDGSEAVQMACSQTYDIVVLDLMLPGRPGTDVLDVLVSRTNTPVIVLTAQTELSVRVNAFERGAADYVAKPFYMDELIARIRTRLAMSHVPTSRVLAFGSHEVDLDGRRVTRAGMQVDLAPAQYNLLAWLAERPNRAVTRAELASSVLGLSSGGADRSVDSHMSRVRQKLGKDGKLISTVWGIGYRYDAPSTSTPSTTTDSPPASGEE